MTKAYDLSALGSSVVADLKANGLQIADQALQAGATSVYNSLKNWVKASVALSPGIVGAVVVKYIDDLDGFVLPEIAKLGQLGQSPAVVPPSA